MISFFSVMIYVTSIIAIVVTLVFYAGILMSNKNISSGQVYTSCSAQLKTCKVSSVVFVLVYWFCVSGLSKKECLKGYAALSKVCSRFGCIWIVFAVVNIALSIVMTITKPRIQKQ